LYHNVLNLPLLLGQQVHHLGIVVLLMGLIEVTVPAGVVVVHKNLVQVEAYILIIVLMVVVGMEFVIHSQLLLLLSRYVHLIVS
jgi:hypothetical protein